MCRCSFHLLKTDYATKWSVGKRMEQKQTGNRFGSAEESSSGFRCRMERASGQGKSERKMSVERLQGSQHRPDSHGHRSIHGHYRYLIDIFLNIKVTVKILKNNKGND